MITNKFTFDPPTRFTRIDPKFNQVAHGHSTPSLKISCKSVQPFSRNVADKETKKERNRPKTIPRPPTGGGVKILQEFLLFCSAKIAYIRVLAYSLAYIQVTVMCGVECV